MNQPITPRGRWDWLAASPQTASDATCHACAKRAAATARSGQQRMADDPTELEYEEELTYEEELEYEEEIARPALKATLRWSGPHSYDDVVKDDSKLGSKHGFYIALEGSNILKVGITARGFRARFKGLYPQGWSFFLAPYPLGKVAAIEHAIARALMRAGEPLPKHLEPRDVLRARGPITIVNPLPTALLARLEAAYASPSPMATIKPKKGKPKVPERYPLATGEAPRQILSLAKDQTWEIS